MFCNAYTAARYLLWLCRLGRDEVRDADRNRRIRGIRDERFFAVGPCHVPGTERWLSAAGKRSASGGAVIYVCLMTANDTSSRLGRASLRDVLHVLQNAIVHV